MQQKDTFTSKPAYHKNSKVAEVLPAMIRAVLSFSFLVAVAMAFAPHGSPAFSRTASELQFGFLKDLGLEEPSWLPDFGGGKDEEKKDESEKKDKKKDDASEKSVTEKSDSNVKWDSITMNIYDGDRLIRTLKRKAPKESGVYKWTWFMDEKGGDRPSRRVRPRRGEPGGVGVKPGTYKVVMTYGDQKSEKSVTVQSDPRLKVSQTNIDQVYNASKELEAMRQTAANAVKQLVESKTTAEEYSKMLAKIDKKKYKDQIKSSKDIIKKIQTNKFNMYYQNRI